VDLAAREDLVVSLGRVERADAVFRAEPRELRGVAREERGELRALARALERREHADLGDVAEPDDAVADPARCHGVPPRKKGPTPRMAAPPRRAPGAAGRRAGAGEATSSSRPCASSSRAWGRPRCASRSSTCARTDP